MTGNVTVSLKRKIGIFKSDIPDYPQGNYHLFHARKEQEKYNEMRGWTFFLSENLIKADFYFLGKRNNNNILFI